MSPLADTHEGSIVEKGNGRGPTIPLHKSRKTFSESTKKTGLKSKTPNKVQRHQRVSLPSPAQGAFLLSSMKDKSVDVMKKSNAIVELLQSNNTEPGAIGDALFSDKLFCACKTIF